MEKNKQQQDNTNTKEKKVSLCRRIVSPFYIVSMHRAAFFVWFMFTLLGGLVGVVISIMRHLWFSDVHYSFKQALYVETTNGSIYTYAIATIAAVLSGLFVLFAEKEKLSYRTLQIPTAALAVFVLLFGGIFYALNINSSNAGALCPPPDAELVLDWKQLVILILALLFSIYTFCLCRIDDHNEEFKDIQDKNYKNSSLKHTKNPLSNEVNNEVNKKVINEAINEE